MAYSHEIDDEVVEAVDKAVQLAAAEVEHPDPDGLTMPTGWLLVAEYMTADGEHWWTIRSRPGQGAVTSIGLSRMAAAHGDVIVHASLSTDEDDD